LKNGGSSNSWESNKEDWKQFMFFRSMLFSQVVATG